MRCPKCGFENRPTARFCKQCGQTLQAKPPTGVTCPTCGAANDSDARFCRSCGKPLGGSPATPPTTPAPPESVSVHIEGSVSGQVAIGNNILQIGDVHGGVVNVMAPGEKIRPEPRPTPVDLRPRPFPNLLDRETEIDTVTAALQSTQPVEIHGQAGLGKTSLLRHLAHHPTTAAFSDGVVYLSARRQPADDLLQSLFDAFYKTDIPYKPTDAQLKHDLQNKRALVLLDDVGLTREDVERLMDTAPTCTFALASPERHLWGEGQSLALGGLPPDDAIALIERELGRPLTPQERPVAQRLRLDSKGNPLALIQIASETREKGLLLTDLKAQGGERGGGMRTADLLEFPRQQMQLIRYITRQGEVTVEAAAEHLEETPADVQQILDTMVEKGNLERVERKGNWVYKMHFARKSARGLPPGIWHALGEGAKGAEAASFADALNALPAPERQTMAALATLGGIPVHEEHLAALTGLPDVTPALQALQRRGLAQAHSPRYSLTGTLDQALQQAWDLTPWMERALTHFTAWVQQNQQAPSRLLEEADAIRYILEWAAGAGRWANVLRLGRAIEGALALGGRWAAWAQVLHWILQAGKTLGDQASEAWALHQLGTQALCLGDNAAAHASLTQALSLREALGDHAGAAITRHNLSLLPPAPPTPPEKPSPPNPRPRLPKWLLPAIGVVAVGSVAMVVGAVLLISGVIQPPPATEQPVEVTETPTKTPTATLTRTPTEIPTEAPWITIDLADDCGKEYRVGDESRITIQSNVGGPVKVWLDKKSIDSMELKPEETWSRIWIFADMSLGNHEFRAVLMSPEGSVLDEDTCPFTLLPACIDFEDLPPGEYDAGQDIFSAGVKITLIEGDAVIEDEEMAGGSGQEIFTTYGFFAFDFGLPLDGLTLRYNQVTLETPIATLEINSKQWSGGFLDSADGITLGGVRVTAGDGFLELDGTINSFMIGGSNLAIDDVCPQ
jgi:DNA-binding IclR family transcriptional regulator